MSAPAAADTLLSVRRDAVRENAQFTIVGCGVIDTQQRLPSGTKKNVTPVRWRVGIPLATDESSDTFARIVVVDREGLPC